MSRIVRVAAPARNDIAEILRFTEREFGEAQRDRYATLIRLAIDQIAADADGLGVRRNRDLHVEVRILHIARRGRHARHVLVFRIAEDGSVDVARLLHDSMDVARHVPDDLLPG